MATGGQPYSGAQRNSKGVDLLDALLAIPGGIGLDPVRPAPAGVEMPTARPLTALAASPAATLPRQRAWSRPSIYLLRPLAAIGVTILGFYTLAQPLRILEARLAGLIGSLVSTDVLSLDGTDGILVLPSGRDPFVALVTPTCSASTVIAGLVGIGLFLIRGSASTRVRAVAAASLVVFGINIVRLAAIVLTGSRFGAEAMVLTHDWFGTAVTLVSAAAAVLIVVRMTTRAPRVR